ncbi:hypothetical protein SDC9_80038 [bioreactor metagenome]|uniref:Uncharacterized protein n=1 Tax=bioreactor metagenome TaxID=1076179 RepID=A0A644Z401_9ZZZZ
MLVVLEQDVVFRFELLDEVRFQRKGFRLVGDANVLEILDLPHHGGDLRRVVLAGLEVLPHAILERNCFSNVNHLACGVEHLVHAGRGGEQF